MKNFKTLRWLALFLMISIGSGCDDSEEGVEPDVGDLETDIIDDDVADANEGEPWELDGALRRPVEVYTDDQGMPHIYAETLEDLFFVNGYVQARDRLGQMEFFRRVSTGTLSEILGSLDSDPIGVDTMFRMLGLKRTAQAYWEEHYDPDNEAHIALVSYTEGVNAFLEAWRQGDEEVNPVISSLFPRQIFRDWEPSDTLAIAKLMALQLTYYTPVYLEMTELRQRLVEHFPADSEDPAVAARSAFFNDVVRFAPATETTHIDGFPHGLSAPAVAPSIDGDLLENARQLHRGLRQDGPLGFDFDPFNARSTFLKGSNNWVISGEHTQSGYPQLANDPHLGLSLPSVFYPLHLVLRDDLDGRDDLELMGVAFVGGPGVHVGRNSQVAWGTTVGFYDYVDIYQEEITGSSDDDEPATVRFDGQDVAVERIVETIGIGSFGNIDEELEYIVEIVPHHGPIIPPSVNNRPLPRQGSEALSVRWVGLEGSSEIDFFMGLWRSESPDDVRQALTHWTVGTSNWLFGFTGGDIYYSGRSDIPLRSAGATTFHPVHNVEGTAPFFVLPGDGSAEWEGFLPDEVIPHALNPESGYLMTANNDPVGVTLDNDPFSEEYYLGPFFAIGFRAFRIEERLQAYLSAGHAMSVEEQIALQDDPHDGFAARLVPHLVETIDTVLDPNVGDEEAPDLASIRAEISGQEAELAEMRDLLATWDFDAPASRQPTGEDVGRSGAATLFNVSVVYLLRNVFGDEMGRLGYYNNGHWSMPQMSEVLGRAILFLMETPEEAFSFDATAGDSLFFDDLNNEDVTETRHTMVVRSVMQARERLATEADFGQRGGVAIVGPQSADPEDWIWGNLHGLFLNGFLPLVESSFRRPSTGLPFYERPGGTWSVSPCGNGYRNFNFTCTGGASLRMVHEMRPDGPVTYNAIPGGVSEDFESPHFDDQIQRWNAADPYLLIDDKEQLGEPEIFDGVY